MRLSLVRFAGGCSGAFVSPNGLVQTNHDAPAVASELSTPTQEFSAAGFYARELKDEVKCPEIEVDQLTDIRDVTGHIKQATDGKDGPAFADAAKAEKAAIAHECSGDNENLQCNVVELYNGGVSHLYKYRRYQDVRLVFAAKDAIADFGGDPDNFEFPRYALDLAFLRVYRDGVPLDSRRTIPLCGSRRDGGRADFHVGSPVENFSPANGEASRILARPGPATLPFPGIGTARHAHGVLDAGRRAGRMPRTNCSRSKIL